MKQLIECHTRPERRYFFLSVCMLIILTGSVCTKVRAQQSQVPESFKQALELYQQDKYREAAAIFIAIPTDEARLFAGKSYFSLGDFNKAMYYLNLVSGQADPSVRDETKYTKALVGFQLHDFAGALDHLHELITSENSGLREQARQFYNQVLEYLTLPQRLDAFNGSNYARVQYDLINSAINKISEPTAMSLLHMARETFAGSPDSTLFLSLKNKITHYNFNTVNPGNIHLKAPEGVSYTLGVALPGLNKNSYEYKASRNLYYGVAYAVDEFNRDHPDMKVFIRYEDTSKDSDSVDVMTKLAWNDHADMIIGPLLSEKAAAMSKGAEKYRILMLPPLANSDTLDADNAYLFQANPTFTVRGKRMADFAVNQQHYNHLAVIAQKNALGRDEAIAFRDEAERLGASVDYFFLADFEKQGFNVTPYTEYFNPDTVWVDSLHSTPVDAVYLPFTGISAPTLINAVLTDFQAFHTKVALLGNQEWQVINLDPQNIQGFSVYYTSYGTPQQGTDAIIRFRKGFNDRYHIPADQFSITGYDCAQLLLQALHRVQNPALLKEYLKTAPVYEGLGSHYYFDSTHINQSVDIFQMTTKGSSLVRVME